MTKNHLSKIWTPNLTIRHYPPGLLEVLIVSQIYEIFKTNSLFCYERNRFSRLTQKT